MRYSTSLCLTSLLVGGASFGQQTFQGRIQPAPPVTIGGVYHASTGAWSYSSAGPGSSALAGPPAGDVLFNNSNPIAFYANESGGGTTSYIGRIPSLTSPAPVGTQNSYPVTGIEFEYATSELDVASGGPGAHFVIGLVDKRESCTSLADNAPATYFIDVVGAPASPVAGQLSGHQITIDVSGLGICLSGDGDGAYDGTTDQFGYGPDAFAYTLQFLDTVSGNAGWIVSKPGQASDNTVFTTSGIGPGGGLGWSDVVYVEDDGADATGCYTYGPGPDTILPTLKILGVADGVECTGCPNDDRYEALGNDDCGSALELNNASLVENLTAKTGDEDYFRVTVQPGDRLDVSVLFSQAQGDLDLRLWNADCTTQLDASSSTSDNESVSWINGAANAADVTIEVLASPSGGPSACADYDMTISAVTPVSGSGYCYGTSQCPCSGAAGADEGCLNTAGNGATFVANGTASISNDTFGFQVSGVPGDKPGLILRGANQVAGGLGNPAGDGLLCTAGQSARSRVQVTSAGSTTYTEFDTGISFGAASYGAGVTANYQFWYRDPSNTCSGAGFNFTNAWTVTWGN